MSDKDLEILKVIDEFTKKHGWPPSVRDIQFALEISSTSVVTYHLTALVGEGYLIKGESQARALALTPDGRMYMESA